MSTRITATVVARVCRVVYSTGPFSTATIAMFVPCFPKQLAAVIIVLQLAIGFSTVHAALKNGQKFRDWTVRCEAGKQSTKPTCYVFQNLLLKKENKRLLHVAISYLAASKQPTAFFTLPLGVSLSGGLSITVDEGKPVRVRYERCDASGCLAFLALTDTLVKTFRGGRWARVAFFDANRRKISVPVSLNGFTAALNALK
jgi:invasion protein IalB